MRVFFWGYSGVLCLQKNFSDEESECGRNCTTHEWRDDPREKSGEDGPLVDGRPSFLEHSERQYSTDDGVSGGDWEGEESCRQEPRGGGDGCTEHPQSEQLWFIHKNVWGDDGVLECVFIIL